MNPITRCAAIMLTLAVAMAALLGARGVLACGPYFPEAMFVYRLHPDFPMDSFAAGHLGVLRPTYARSYLVVAYRYMSGIGFNSAEQAAVQNVWKERLANFGDGTDSDPAGDAWQKARARVGSASGQQPPANPGRYHHTPGAGFSSYLNCPADALRTAARTLDDRIAKYGEKSATVVAWAEAQDQVFADCSGGSSIPDPLTAAGADPLARADREYQIASAHFYAGHFEEARKRFTAISADTASPWHVIAPYLVARAYIRQATLPTEDNKGPDMGLLKAAAAQLEKVAADPERQAMHGPAERLLGFVLFRLDPEKRVAALAAALLRPNSEQTIRQNLWDYTWLLDNLSGDVSAIDESKPDKLPAVITDTELSDWLFTFQDKRPQAAAHAIEKWSASQKLPWLVAALATVTPGDPHVPSLIAAAERVDRSSPAYVTVAYYTVRFLIGAGRVAEAREKLESLLGGGTSTTLQSSTINALLSERMVVARNLDEFLRDAQREPAGISEGDNALEVPDKPADLEKEEQLKRFAKPRPMFAPDGAAALNESLPVSVLAEAAASERLEPELRKELAMAVWVRAGLLNDNRVGSQAAAHLNSLAPELREHLDAYRAAATDNARRFAVLFAALRFPGLRPLVNPGIGRNEPLDETDHFRDNWWCTMGTRLPGINNGTYDDESAKTAQRAEAPVPAFLTAPERQRARTELAQLASLGTAPNYLCDQVVAWARAHPDDARVPEALHLAVVATRYGCANKDTGTFSKAAFQLLHTRYPQSEWTKKTPYWFKGYE